MSTTIKKYKIQQLQANDDMLELHPETDADVVNYSNTIDGTAVSNVKAALDKVASGIGVTGVKGNAETDYRKGNVNITPANIGLGNVSNDAQVKGLASGTSENDIVTWGANGYAVKDSGKSFTTSVSNSTNAVDTKIPTEKGVRTAVDAALQSAIEVAEGKTKNYVIDDTETGTGIVNSSFASNPLYNYIEITISGNSIKTVGGTFVELSTLKVGDIISITNTSVPDRWVGNISNGKIQFYALEIKLNIDTNFTNPSNNPVSSSAVKTYVDDAISGVNTTIGNLDVLNIIEKNVSSNTSITATKFTTSELSSIEAGTFLLNTSDNHVFVYYGKKTTYGDYNANSHVFVDLTDVKNTSSSVAIIEVCIETLSGSYSAGDWIRSQRDLGTYSKPTNGIPKTDLASGVQTSLGLADTAYQKPTNGIPASDLKYELSSQIASAYQKPSSGIPSSDLATSGVTAGTYSAVTVNDKGLVTAGAQIIEVGATSQTTPSASLAVGGLFFKEI